MHVNKEGEDGGSFSCRALRQRQSRFPVLLLSTGGTSWHADMRRMSIAAAISFVLEAGLQGLVLDSGAVQEQLPAIAAARSKGLKVRPLVRSAQWALQISQILANISQVVWSC